MKAKLLKISVMTAAIIFLFAGASWADGGKSRHHKQVRNKHFRTEHPRSDRNPDRSHYNRRSYQHPRRHYQKHYDRHRAVHRAERYAFKHRQKNHRPVHRQDRYRHKVINKHYHKHKRSYNVFSFRAPVFEPGWSVTFKTKSRW